MATDQFLKKTKHRLFFWVTAFFIFSATIWLLKDILLPFILGFGIAYLLEPLQKKISNGTMPRWASTLLILFIFFAVVLSLIAVIVPIAYHELQGFIAAIPALANNIWAMMEPHVIWVQDKLGINGSENLGSDIKSYIGNALNIGNGMLAGLASGGQAVIGFLSTLLITPIVAFFMMKQWPAITQWIDDLIPRDHYKTIKSLMSKMDKKLSGFVRGQLTVAVILALIYALALTIAGLNYGFIIGLMAGLLSVIPLFGSTIGLLTSIIVAWFQAKSFGYVLVIAAIFVVGQLVEGNVITPRVLGKNVGLHPLWILFGLMVGGGLFGIVGMLLAVPVTAVCGVLTSFFLEQYKDSALYKTSKPKKKKAKA